MNGVLLHHDRLRLSANFQDGVNNERGVRVDGDARSLVGLEARLFDHDVVAPDGKDGKGVESAVIRCDPVLNSGGDVGRTHGCVRNHGVACVLHGAGHAPINASPGIDGEEREECKEKEDRNTPEISQDRGGRPENGTPLDTDHAAFLLVKPMAGSRITASSSAHRVVDFVPRPFTKGLCRGDL